ncbi:transcription factor atf1 [Fusarium beomiforme]|uniref:Transcription factor atf1 n=1 Tax=Fusarium beomiforme TaxID=44412 RepID=A0A9P5DSL7_9HYPO|nr:transcription factor atf1 [Fusarium beomiforme]
MASVLDWNVNTRQEPDHDLVWEDVPECLIPWNWLIPPDIYSHRDAPISEPLVLSPPSRHYHHDVLFGGMLDDTSLYSIMPSESPFSLSTSEKSTQCNDQIAPNSPEQEAATDTLQDHHECPSDGTDSTPSQSSPGVESPVSSKAIEKTRKNTMGRRLLGDANGANGINHELSRAEQERYMKVLERNRRAAAKCRARKQDQHDALSAQVEELRNRNKELSDCCNELRETVIQLKTEVLRHGDCNCTLIQLYIESEAVKYIDKLISSQSPCNSLNSEITSTAKRVQPVGNNGRGRFRGVVRYNWSVAARLSTKKGLVQDAFDKVRRT